MLRTNLWLDLDCEYNQEVRMSFGCCTYAKWNQEIHTELYPGIKGLIILFWVRAAHISCVYDSTLSFEILDNWNINN
jgi:hypothetical protein